MVCVLNYIKASTELKRHPQDTTQFPRNVRQQNACEQAELILRAVLDPVIASRARRGEFVRCLDRFDLLQTAIN
jgi:hypothetical protein